MLVLLPVDQRSMLFLPLGLSCLDDEVMNATIMCSGDSEVGYAFSLGNVIFALLAMDQ